MSAAQVKSVIGAVNYTVVHTDGPHQWLGDEGPELGGANAGPAPAQLILSGLGACTAITLKMYAARKNWPLEGVEVQLTHNPKGRPADGATEIARHITLKGPLDGSQRERLLQIADRCPMHKLLTGSVRIASDLAE